HEQSPNGPGEFQVGGSHTQSRIVLTPAGRQQCPIAHECKRELSGRSRRAIYQTRRQSDAPERPEGTRGAAEFMGHLVTTVKQRVLAVGRGDSELQELDPERSG